MITAVEGCINAIECKGKHRKEELEWGDSSGRISHRCKRRSFGTIKERIIDHKSVNYHIADIIVCVNVKAL